MKSTLSKVWKAYMTLIDKQGFPVVVTVCVAVITATLLYKSQPSPSVSSPTPPPQANVSAAQLVQQSLIETISAAPSPSPSALTYPMPLETIKVLRSFSSDKMFQGSVTGIWSIHDAVDLACSPGDKICASADGIVVDSGHDTLQCAWLQLETADGLVFHYAGMYAICDYLTGDRVYAGDVIGYAGSGPMDEQDLEPHLHLRVTRHGLAIDPLSLFQE